MVAIYAPIFDPNTDCSYYHFFLRKATPINSQQSIQKKLHSVFGTRKRTAHQHAHAIHHIHIHLHGLKLVHEFPPVMVSYHSV